MKHFFYYQIIDLTELETKISEYNLTSEEGNELLLIIKETIHCQIVTEILTELDEEHHEWFLNEYTQIPHKKSFLEKLETKIDNLEDKIKDIFDKIKTEILEELEKED